jgi:hypothetical protein
MSVTPTPDDANGLSLDASAQRIKDVRLENFVDFELAEHADGRFEGELK